MPKTQYLQQKEESQPLFMKRGDILSEFFEISDKAREGGMGDVFFCRDRRDNKFYVLKTYKDVADKDKAIAWEDFRKEALIMFKMPRLPYVVFTRTLVVGEYKLYVLMDFIGKQPHGFDEPVQGENLANVLQSTKVEYKQALIWGIEFCRGIQYLHKYGVPVHKDIKPENILLAPDNTIRIADFGLSALNKKGGTKGYLPPEYSEKQDLTEQSDIYSFGVVLYQLFNNVSVPKLNRNKVAENAILKKCLSVDPSGRYQGFAHLEKDLIKELKLHFPEYILPPSPKYSTTADEYFFKGLGAYLLSQYARTFDHSVKENLNLEAEKLFSKCLALNSKHAAACYYHSKILVEENGFVRRLLHQKENVTWGSAREKKIARHVRNELKRAQKNSSFYANLIEMEYYREANIDIYMPIQDSIFLKKFKQHSARHPKDPYLHNNAGVFEAKTGHYQKAIEQFTKAIRLMPDYAVAHANRASVYLWLNQERKALKDCAKYTQLQCDKKTFIPTSLFYGIYVQIFDRYCRQKKYEEAYAWYETHLNLLSEIKPADRKKMLARVLFQIQHVRLLRIPNNSNRKEVLKEYRAIWKLYKQIKQERIPMEPSDWFDSQEQQSLRVSNIAFPSRPNMERIFYNRMCITHPSASRFNEIGRYVAQWGCDYLSDCALMEMAKHPGLHRASYGKRSLPYFNKAIELNNMYAPAYYNRARAYMECAEYSKAIADYTRAINLDPQHVFYCEKENYMSAMYGLVAGRLFERDLSNYDPLWLSNRIKTKISSHYIGNHIVVDREIKYVGDTKSKDYETLLVKAQFYYMLGKFRRALTYVEKAEQMGAQIGQGKKAICYYQIGQYQEALDCLLKLSDKETLYSKEANIALCYAKLGKKKEEEKYLGLAIDAFMLSVGLALIPGTRLGTEMKTKRKVLVKKVNKQLIEVRMPKKLLKTFSNYFTNHYEDCLAKNQVINIPDYRHEEGTSNFANLGAFSYIQNAYFQRANAYFELGDYVHAVEDYQNATKDTDRMLFIIGFKSFIKERITICNSKLHALH